jgi:PBSX family phage terminase large subunit
MMNKLKISKKFQPLFCLFNDNFHPEIDTVIITGGRYSLKSYTVSIFALTALVNYGWNTLYTRFTNMSILDSVKPEVSDKIELLGLVGQVANTQNHIGYNGNHISFKGIKTGSKGQTANLKSLSGFNLFVNDEAEELPDYKTFKKIFYSIRSATKRNLTVLILNPTNREHWIFTEFFEKKGLQGGDNCIVDNVMYIHSSYLDADQAQIPKNILSDYHRMKLTDPDMYDNIVMGGWITEIDGQIFPKSSLKTYREFPENMEYFTIGAIDTADEGKDHFSMPIARVYGDRVYIFDAIFDQNNLTIQEGQVESKVKECIINKLYIETNSFGAYFRRRLDILLPWIETFGQFSKSNKMGRIIASSGLIKLFFYFPENPNPTLQKFMNQVTRLMHTSTEEDDAADSLAAMAAHLEKMYGLFKSE